MAAITWTDSYSVGDPMIDGQHKNLINLINQLETADRDGIDLRDVLDKLDRYVHEHFSYEETRMRNANYTNLEEHVAEHREFETWLRSAQSHMAMGGLDTAILARSIHDHLRDWLLKHILVVDMAYKGSLS